MAAGGVTSATGLPKRVTRTGTPDLRTSSRTARHVALNLEIGISFIVIYYMVKDHGQTANGRRSALSKRASGGEARQQRVRAALEISYNSRDHALAHRVRFAHFSVGLRIRSAPTYGLSAPSAPGPSPFPFAYARSRRYCRHQRQGPTALNAIEPKMPDLISIGGFTPPFPDPASTGPWPRNRSSWRGARTPSDRPRGSRPRRSRLSARRPARRGHS